MEKCIKGLLSAINDPQFKNSEELEKLFIDLIDQAKSQYIVGMCDYCGKILSKDDPCFSSILDESKLDFCSPKHREAWRLNHEYIEAISEK